MSKRFIFALTGALSVFAAGPAMAAVVSYGPFGNGGAISGPDSFVIGVTRFNPSLGTLTGVELTLKSQLSASGQAMNTNGPDDTFNIEINGSSSLANPVSASTLTSITLHATGIGSAPTQPFPSGYFVGTGEQTATTGTLNTPALLAALTGVAPINLTVNVSGTTSITGVASNVSLFGQALASANYINVTYTYTPAPEPTTAMLMAGAVILVARRRRA